MIVQIRAGSGSGVCRSHRNRSFWQAKGIIVQNMMNVKWEKICRNIFLYAAQFLFTAAKGIVCLRHTKTRAYPESGCFMYARKGIDIYGGVLYNRGRRKGSRRFLFSAGGNGAYAFIQRQNGGNAMFSLEEDNRKIGRYLSERIKEKGFKSNRDFVRAYLDKTAFRQAARRSKGWPTGCRRC